MNELFDQYCLHLMTRQRVALNTYASYRRDVRQFLDFYSTYEKALDMRELLIDFRDKLLQEGTSARSLARKLSALRNFFKYMDEYHPTVLPLKDLTALISYLPKMERRLPRVCAAQEITQLIEASRSEAYEQARAELICLLLYSAGLRVSELVSLTLGAFHLPTRRLTIRGKGGKMRVIPLIEPTCTALEAYKALCATTKPSDLLFPQEHNKQKPFTRQSVWRLIKRIARNAGLSSLISPHVLRHAIATHSLEEGWDLRSLQLFLGHERIVTTEIYIHLDTKFVRGEYKKRHPRK